MAEWQKTAAAGIGLETLGCLIAASASQLRLPPDVKTVVDAVPQRPSDPRDSQPSKRDALHRYHIVSLLCHSSSCSQDSCTRAGRLGSIPAVCVGAIADCWAVISNSLFGRSPLYIFFRPFWVERANKRRLFVQLFSCTQITSICCSRLARIGIVRLAAVTWLR